MPGIGEVTRALIQALPYPSHHVPAAGFIGPRRWRPRRSACPTRRSTEVDDLLAAGAHHDGAGHAPYSKFAWRCGARRRRRHPWWLNVRTQLIRRAFAPRPPPSPLGRAGKHRVMECALTVPDPRSSRRAAAPQKLRGVPQRTILKIILWPRRRASHRDARPASADVVRPHMLGKHDRRDRRQGARLQAKGSRHPTGRASAPSPRRCRPSHRSHGELPGFPRTTVGSHAGKLVLGLSERLRSPSQGRAHYYERGRADEMKGCHQAIAELGCEPCCKPNAAGSLRLDMPPGSLMAITDHLNFTGVNPLSASARATIALSTWSTPMIPHSRNAFWRRPRRPISCATTASISGSAARARDAGRDPCRRVRVPMPSACRRCPKPSCPHAGA